MVSTPSRARPRPSVHSPQIAAAFSPGLRAAFRLILVVLLGLPLVIGHAVGVEVPLAVVAYALAIPFLAHTLSGATGLHVIVAAGLALLALLAGLMLDPASPSLRPLLSYAYFWTPFLLFPVGQRVVRSANEFDELVSHFSLLASMVGTAVGAGLLFSGTPVRGDGVLMGTLFGLPLYASYGVNSLATLYAIMVCLIVTDLVFSRGAARIWIPIKLCGLVSLIYLVIFSLSRGAILGMLTFVVLLVPWLLRHRPKMGLFALVLGVAMVVTAFRAYGDVIQLAWSGKLERRADVSTIDVLTSGRLTLYMRSLQDLAESPLVGSAFGGYRSRSGVPFLIEQAVNSSPHNQYLTAVWKMGVVAGAVYLALLFRFLAAARDSSRRFPGTAATGVFLMLLAVMMSSFLTWDILLVPNLGALFLFLCGGLTSLSTTPSGKRFASPERAR